MSRTELVIFDCDGVVIDSEMISARMLVEAMALRRIDIDLDYVRKHFLGRSYPIVMQQIRESFGVDLPPEFEAEYRERLLAAFARDLKPMPGIHDVLHRLAVPYCLATSSSPKRVRRSLEIAGLDEAFGDRVTTVAEVAHGKPAPDLFLRAAEKMAAAPETCLVIEDSLNGLAAARAAGMEVWHFTGGAHLADNPVGDPEDGPHTRRFASFADFFQIRPQLKSAGDDP